MTAPDTNTEKQTKRHKGPLLGIAAALVFSFIIAIVLIGVMDEGEVSGDAPDVNPVEEGDVAN